MADGLNDARAMRIAEVMNDYQGLQTQIAGYGTYQNNEQTAGLVLLRQGLSQARQLLAQPFQGANIGDVNDDENTKALLQRVLVDAVSRRFQAMRLFQRLAAAIRWIQKRNQILQGRSPGPQHQQALSQIDNQLRQEVLAVTDQRVYAELSAKDARDRVWTAEMPTLTAIQQFIGRKG